MSLLTELRRRNVLRVGLFYLVASWLVVQIAETVLPVFDVPDVFVRGTVILLAIGFVPALVFAWAFELTPEGLKLDKDARSDAENRHASAQKLNWATLAAALLAIGLLIADRLAPEPGPVAVGATPPTAEAVAGAPAAPNATPAPDPASIAVLPFADLSPDGDQQYFSDGIAEEILNVLSKIESLNVTSRTSAFAFRSQSELGIRDIAAALDVRHVLEGSVRKAADTIRVTAQLIDASSDQHLWSETFERQLTARNVFAIQDEIAAAITRELAARLNLSLEESANRSLDTKEIDAYEAFLAGRELFVNRNYDNLPPAVRQFERAVEADPAFARAWGWLAMAYVVSPAWGFEDRDYESLGEEAAQRALELSPDDPAALTALGYVHQLLPDPDYGRAIEYYERAIAADPQSTTTQLWLAQLWRSLGFLERANDVVERCLEVDPDYPLCLYSHAEFAALQKRYPVAIARLMRIFETSHQEAYPQFLGIVAEHDDEILMVLMLRELADMVGPGFRWMVGDLRRALSDEAYDRTAALDRFEARLRAERGKLPDAYTVTAYLLAFRAYDRIPENQGEAASWWWFPGYPGLVESPRRKQAMIAAGLPAYWRAHGFPPQCRPLGETDFECD